ncbi:MAG: nitrile hydratase subunit beta [SAR202 cluster bacterium]|nr:nitrile hydratase subunit beta [SAR202 cluster bacterium]
MNSIHDMGGMHGFGPIVVEVDEPVFHEEWEGRAYALSIGWFPASQYKEWGGFRHNLEKIPPKDYLNMSYYERWFFVNEQKAMQLGLVTEEELNNGNADPNYLMPTLEPHPDSSLGPGRLDLEINAKFENGGVVRAKEINGRAHNRLPRYVRGKTGTIISDNGIYALQDTNEKDEQPYDDPQHVYTVRFSSEELWGNASHGNDFIYLDLWESYLEFA